MITSRLSEFREKSMRAAHACLRSAFRARVGAQSGVLQDTLEELTSVGAVVLRPDAIDALGLTPTAAFLAEADRLTTDGAIERAGRKSYVASPSPELTARSPAVVGWPLTDQLVRFVRAYIGLPIKYRGVQPRRDKADGQQVETRLWHRDGEDSRIVKLIVYLTDVGPDDGPFTYVAKSALADSRRVRQGRVSDADMDALVDPSKHWRACGPRGTVVMTDTCVMHHKGGVPARGDRRALFYAFNSAMPVRPSYCTALHPWDGMPEDWQRRWAPLLAPLGQ